MSCSTYEESAALQGSRFEYRFWILESRLSFENGGDMPDGITGWLVESTPPTPMVPASVIRRRRRGRVNAAPTKSAIPGARCLPLYWNSPAPGRVTRVWYL